jgi:hypothetical protein
MKRKALIIAIVLMTTAASIFGLEIGGVFQMGNLGFTKDRLSTDTSFTGLDFFSLGNLGFSVFASHSPDESSRLEIEYAYDHILRNLLTSLFIYRGNFFSIGVGPFLGFLNASQLTPISVTTMLPKVGISSIFRVELPGIVFASLGVENTTNNQLTKVGHYLQERTTLAVGFYVPNAICSVNYINKRFVEQKAVGLQVSDLFSEYSFKVDIFQKNIPYRILLSFGLQDLKKVYEQGATVTTHTLYSLVIGTRGDIEVSDFLRLIFDVDSSVYTFGYDELVGLSNPGPLGYLFRAKVGFALNMEGRRVDTL